MRQQKKKYPIFRIEYINPYSALRIPYKVFFVSDGSTRKAKSRLEAALEEDGENRRRTFEVYSTGFYATARGIIN